MFMKLLDRLRIVVCAPFSLPARCAFSRMFFDIHDYPKRKGGDGTPSHFHKYTCSNCGAGFTI